MSFPAHIINCRVTLRTPTQTKTAGVPQPTYADTYTGIPARISPESSTESMGLMRETGIRYSAALMPTRNDAGADIMVKKNWRVKVTAVYGQHGVSMLTAGQEFMVDSVALNMAGQDCMQTVRLKEVT